MKTLSITLGICLALGLLFGPAPRPAVAAPPEIQAQDVPIVHAVMFWMDGCSHCQAVLENVLPPLQASYGLQLDIFLIELKSAPEVDLLYQTAASLGLSKEEVGVPFLLIGEHILVGSDQIPAELPGLIEQYLAQGGVAYPAIEALASVLPASAEAREAGAVPDSSNNESGASNSATPGANGFLLAWAVLAAAAAALPYAGIRWLRVRSRRIHSPRPAPAWRKWALPALSLIGLGVAGYLAYIETQRVTAFCGPVGDCNAVQASPYARLFGILPVGVLGVFGYAAILANWSWQRWRDDRLARLAPQVTFGLTFAGTLFSLYLTYVELFVIRAVCLWCLSSAFLMTLLLLFSLEPALEQISRRTKPARAGPVKVRQQPRRASRD